LNATKAFNADTNRFLEQKEFDNLSLSLQCTIANSRYQQYWGFDQVH